MHDIIQYCEEKLSKFPSFYDVDSYYCAIWIADRWPVMKVVYLKDQDRFVTYNALTEMFIDCNGQLGGQHDYISLDDLRNDYKLYSYCIRKFML